MSIIKAISRAYKVAKERNWDKIYYAIDLHGVCFPSSYEKGNYQFINEDTLKGLQVISQQKESVIILWSSCYKEEQSKIMEFFRSNGVNVSYFNKNPNEANTNTGDFSEKFYFSVLLDDKAGFDPELDWKKIIYYFIG
jgi:hypothetical protein